MYRRASIDCAKKIFGKAFEGCIWLIFQGGRKLAWENMAFEEELGRYSCVLDIMYAIVILETKLSFRFSNIEYRQCVLGVG